MNQKETKQVVETQESKEKMVVLKLSPKWWIGMAAVGGLLVGAGIVKMAILHKETSKRVAYRTAVLKAVVLKVVAKDMVVHKAVVLVRCHRKAMVALKEMVQKMA